MKLSSINVVSEYREQLRTLRHARNSIAAGLPGSFNCKTWYHGEQIDFSVLIGKSKMKTELGRLIDHEIAETVRLLQAHGVVVDE